MKQRPSFVIVAVVLAGASAHAQGRGAVAQAPFGAPPAPIVRTASLSGQVVDADTGAPIGGAVVRLQSRLLAAAAGPAGGRGAGPVNPLQPVVPPGADAVTTDGDGRFVFHDLPKGAMQLTATASGFLDRPAAGVPQRPIQLEDGQHLGGARLRLLKVASVSGVVLDEAGEPVVGLPMRVLRREVPQGIPRLTLSGFARTDDRGQYRLDTLAPGQLYVLAPQTQSTVPVADAERSASPMGMDLNPLIEAMTGGTQMTLGSPGVRVGDQILRTSGDLSGSGNVPPPPVNGRIAAYQTTFYPGVKQLAQAMVITLRSGEDRASADFQIRPTRPRRRVLRSGGAVGNSRDAGRGRDKVAGPENRAEHSVTRRTILLAGLLVVAISAWAANAAFAQVRDMPRAAVGSASITGAVMTDSPTPRPIRRVIVSLTETSAARAPVSAITDDVGLFTFRDLPPGVYTLVATRAAYVASAYGAKTYGRGSGVPISLSAGQVIKDITLKMIRGGVIAGTLRDAVGRPAANAELILLTSKNENGRRRMAAIAQSAQTDSRGEYRIYGLPPGDYVVRAQPPWRAGQPGLRPTTAAELEWARKAAAGGATDAPPPIGRPAAYAASYYPGTSDASTASPVTVAASEERQGIDFAFQMIATATISGRVTGPDGQPARSPSAALQTQSTSAGSFIDAIIGVAQSGGIGGGFRVGEDGKFSVSGVGPGRYRMTFHGTPPGAPAGAMGATLWATEAIVINGQDVTDLDIRLQPGVSMSGTVVFEGEDPQAPPDASRASLSLHNADREASSALEMVFGMMSGSTPGRATKERTFTIDGISPARYRLVASPPGVMNPFGSATMVSPDGWVLKSAMWNDRDLADETFEIQPGDQPTGVVVTFTKAVTEISGRLLSASGMPTSGFPIVVFSTEPSEWTGGSRRVTSVKPSSDGTYKIRGLPAGEYYVCALLDLDLNDLYDATFLEELTAASSKITLADGERKTQDLKLGGGL